MGIEHQSGRRIPALAAAAAFAFAACTPDRSGDVQKLEGQLAECRAQLATASAVSASPAPAPAAAASPKEGPPAASSATGIQAALDTGFGTDLSSAAVRRMLVPILEKLVTTGVEGDLGRAPTDLYGWDRDRLVSKKAALLALVGSDGNRLVTLAEQFVKVVQALPPAMQEKLAAEMSGFIGTFDVAFAKYPQYKLVLAHHDLWRDSPENGFTDPCAGRGRGALHDQYQKFSGGVKRAIRMFAALEAQGMPLAKVKEAVTKARVAFGL